MNAQEYTAALRRIEDGNPGEVLLPVLRTGHSRVNEMYLRSALRRIPSPQSHTRSMSPLEGGRGVNLEGGQGREEEPDWKSRTPYADETLRALWRERTRLFSEMNKQSNLFHECRTDADRAGNSAKVLSWWDDILAAKAKIAWYEQHGELPPVAEDGDELPDNAALLAKKLNSLRARVSQVKKKLLDIASLDEGTPGKQSKINAAEDDLKQLRFMAGKAEEKLKAYEQTA